MKTGSFAAGFVAGLLLMGSAGETRAAADSSSVTTSVDSLRIGLEPGVVASGGDALLPIRVATASGAPRRAAECALAFEVDGESVSAFEILSPRSTIAVLVDPSAIPESDRDNWTDELAKALVDDASDSGVSRRLYFCGPRLREVTATREAIAAAFASPSRPRLYDGVVEAVGRLSASPPALERLAILVVASGVEADESRHPLVSCIGAADTARVAIHTLVLPAKEGGSRGEARLRELATKCGGVSRSAGGGASAFASAFERASRVEGIRFRVNTSNVSTRRAVRVLAPDAAPATGSVAPRVSLGFVPERPFPWLPLLAGSLLLGGAAFSHFARTRSLGRLRVVRGAPEISIPIYARGVTLGGAKGNRLVFEDSRISRNHAVIQVRGREITLIDLRSTNGTQVNGSRVTTRALSDGDRILLAEAVELVYEGPGKRRRRNQTVAAESGRTATVAPRTRARRDDVDHEDDDS